MLEKQQTQSALFTSATWVRDGTTFERSPTRRTGIPEALKQCFTSRNAGLTKKQERKITAQRNFGPRTTGLAGAKHPNQSVNEYTPAFVLSVDCSRFAGRH